ncbi:hypothetical protein GQS_02105 [Thermococcus sp. 4557]|uniref:hypothetical protein n=1 Tax=Thermococcus sp. (strain CGMCC 1.5172 / 4557) TaxID=1042877 RepID=UPI000219ED4C|nr:hypothetical protein [Thermococcus sp. 4557]AEK72322.1 hypothetical protein GQS_02105 [Thermococcus sp. 4557]
MRLRSLSYLFLFPAWEFLLMILLPSDYYVGASCLQIRPYPICGFYFSPSATFVLLVTAPFLISIILGLWKEWSELVAFGIPSLAVVLVTLLLLYLFEKSWISFFVPATVSVVLYSLPCIRLDGPIKRAERLVWIATSLIVSFILCIMAWGGTSVSV